MLFIPFFLGAGGSGTFEIGLAFGSDGQMVVFSTFCIGFKLDVSAEVDILVGWVRSLDDIPGQSYQYAFGTVYILGQ